MFLLFFEALSLDSVPDKDAPIDGNVSFVLTLVKIKNTITLRTKWE
jgi:hypothetical protein